MNTEQLIDGYLSHSLNAAQREVFEATLSRDAALRASVRAEQLIRGAMHKDRTAVPSTHAALFDKAMRLAQTVPGAAHMPPPQAGLTAGSSGVAGTNLITAIIGAASIITGAILFSLSGDSPLPWQAAPGQEQRSAPATQGETPRSAVSQEPAVRSSTEAAPDAAGGTSGERVPHSGTSVAPSEQPPALERIDHRRTGTSQGATVVTSDTARLDVRVNLPKEKKGEGD